jgi:hypothetical protein
VALARRRRLPADPGDQAHPDPGHTLEDITLLAGTRHGVVAFTHLWNHATAVGDRHAVDLAGLHAGRRRVLAVADTIVPGHGAAFTPDTTTPG